MVNASKFIASKARKVNRHKFSKRKTGKPKPSYKAEGPHSSEVCDLSSVTYFTSVITRLQNGFNSEETKDQFLDNVFDEVSDHIKQESLDKNVVSTIMKLVSHASRKQIQCLLENMISGFQSLIMNQTSTPIIFTILNKAVEFFDDEEENAVMDLVSQFGEIVLDSKAPHENVMLFGRCILEVMSGIKSSAEETEKHLEEHEMKEGQYFSKFSRVMLKFADCVLSNESFRIGVGSKLLYTLSKADRTLYADLCERIATSDLFDSLEGGVPRLLVMQFGSRFCMMSVLGMQPAVFGKFFDEHILPYMNVLLERKFTDTILSVVIKKCVQSDEQFDAVLRCLKGKLFYFLQPATEKGTIVSSFCESAIKYPARQAAIMDLWKKEMEKWKTNFVVAMCLGGPEHNFSSSELPREISKISTAQSFTLRALVMYEDTSYLSSCYEALPVEIKLALVRSCSGLHSTAAMLNSPTVPQKVKTDFIATPKEFIIKLVSQPSSSGKDFFDWFWAKLSLPVQMEMMSIMAASMSEIKSTNLGRNAAARVFLEQYIDDKAKWEERMVKENEARGWGKRGQAEDSHMLIANGQTETTGKRKSMDVDDEDVHGQTTPVAKKKKRTEGKETESASQDKEMDTEVPSAPAAKSPESTEDVGTPAKVVATPAASPKKSAKKRKSSKLVENVSATEEMISPPTTPAPKSAKETPKKSKDVTTPKNDATGLQKSAKKVKSAKKQGTK